MKSTAKNTAPEWTRPAFLNAEDHRALAYVNELFQDGQYAYAKQYASNLDTIVREEIPAQIWETLKTA